MRAIVNENTLHSIAVQPIVGGSKMTPRILLIDDEDDVRDDVRQMLEHEGIAVTCAANGQIAMRIYHKEAFDLVITDLLMPERDGLEVIMELKQASPDVKIIAMAGGSQTRMYDMLPVVARKLGAQRALIKPFTAAELLDAIREVLEE
jgi:DNA-binding NtrC family response regulator